MSRARRRSRTALWIVLGLLPCAHKLEAQQQPAAAPEAPPIEIVVTGSRIEERIDRAASATEVIRRKDIEQSGARNAAELLEERPGMQVVRSFRGAELQLRGLDPEYTLILVDGERVPGQIDGVTDLTRFGVETIERIEIVRGPGSALYGSDAIGGVVNILTRESKRPFEASALADYGQHSTLDLTGMVAGRPVEPLRLLATGEWHSVDALRREGERNTALSAREDLSTGGRLSFQPDERNTFVLRGNYLRTNLTGIDAGGGGALFDRTQLQEQLLSGFTHRLRATRRFQLISRLSYTQFRDQYLLDQRGSRELDQYENNRERLGQITSIASLEPADGQRTTLGVEQLFQNLQSARLSHSGQRYRLGVFAQHAWLVFENDDSELEIVPGLRLDADTQFGTQLSPKLALRYKAHPNVELRASYGRGFRAPTFQEQLLRFENPSVGYVVIGNPDLRAETSDGFDVGARVFNDVFDVHLTFFRNDLRNMIAYDSRTSDVGGMLFIYDNITTAWTMGVESSVSARWREWVSGTLSYTLTNTWDGENRRRLEGRAPHRFSANARLVHPGSGLEFVVRGAFAIGRTFYVDAEDGSEDQRAVVTKPLKQLDLRVAKHFGRALELFVGLDNLFDAGDAFTALRPLTVYGGVRGRY